VVVFSLSFQQYQLQQLINSVSIDASCSNFEFYSSGLFDSGCGSASNDHAVTLVGFMNAADNPANDLGADYFIAKNRCGVGGCASYGFAIKKNALADRYHPLPPRQAYTLLHSLCPKFEFWTFLLSAPTLIPLPVLVWPVLGGTKQQPPHETVGALRGA
jgi:hypothetical protein